LAEIDHPYGYTKDEKVYLKGFAGMPDRIIGEVKESKEAAIQYFVDRFNLALNKVAEVEKAIEEAENKGSYLMKVKHLKEQMHNFDALGDFIPLIEKLQKMEEELDVLIEENRVKNLELKESLLKEAKELNEMSDWKEATVLFKALKEKWVKTGNVIKDKQDVMEETFRGEMDKFFQKKKNYYETKKALTEQNIKTANAMLDEFEKNSPTMAVGEKYKASKHLQFTIKKMGKIPGPQGKWINMRLKKLTGAGGPSSGGQKRYDANRSSHPQNRFPRREGLVPRSNYGSTPRPSGDRDGGGGYQKQGNFRERRNFVPGAGANIPTKAELLTKMKDIYANSFKWNVKTVQFLQGEWPKTGRVQNDEEKEMAKEFFKLADLVREHLLLESLVKSENPDYDFLTSTSQVKLKRSLEEDLLVQAEKDLQDFIDSVQHQDTSDEEEQKLMQRKLFSLRRRVDIKKLILKELARKLEN
jgi:hypothetical protein